MMTKKTKSYIQLTGRNSLAIVQKHFPKVQHVDDADDSIEITVTKHDDQISTKKSPIRCAMAIALKRELHLDGVIMSIGVAYAIKGDRAVRYHVPKRTAREVIAFDRGGYFAPGTYKLNKPHRSARLGAKQGGPSESGPAIGHRRTPHVLTTGIRPTLGSRDL